MHPLIALSLLLVPLAQPASPASSQPASGDKFVNPETAVLELYVGPWSVTEKHFDPKGRVTATVKGTEEIDWILDRRAIRRTYTTSSGSQAYRAVGILTWNDAQSAYRGAWFDNTSTAGPNMVTGQWQAENNTMVFVLESTASGGERAEYKVVEQFEGPERRRAITYRVDGSQVFKVLEVEYQRTIPCPDRLRVVFDGLEGAPGQ